MSGLRWQSAEAREARELLAVWATALTSAAAERMREGDYHALPDAVLLIAGMCMGLDLLGYADPATVRLHEGMLAALQTYRTHPGDPTALGEALAALAIREMGEMGDLS